MVLAIECVVITILLLRTATTDPWRKKVWCWIFTLLAISSFLGALAHGLTLPDYINAALWKPLYLSNGILVALFFIGAVADLRFRTLAQRLTSWSIGVGAVFFGITEFISGTFTVFLAYEAIALVSTLPIYAFLSTTSRLRGAGVITLGILLSLMAAGLQASTISLHLLLPFDHNGAFHLAQILSTVALGLGAYLAIKAD